MRPYIFGVDLDGVLGNYTKALKETVAQERGINPDELTDDVSWGYNEWGITTRDDFLKIHEKAVVNYRIFRDMDVMEDAAKTLWELSDMGVYIRIITHRFHVGGQHAHEGSDTLEWLDKNNIPYRGICFEGYKANIGCDIYIDDAPHNIEALRNAGNDVIIYDQPFNKNVPGLRAHNWNDVKTIIKNRMNARGFKIGETEQTAPEQRLRRLDDKN